MLMSLITALYILSYTMLNYDFIFFAEHYCTYGQKWELKQAPTDLRCGKNVAAPSLGKEQ